VFRRSGFLTQYTSPRVYRAAIGGVAGTREWSDFHLENFSGPPFSAPKTHQVNQPALKHLRKIFESRKLAEMTADDIEIFLRMGLKQRALVKTKDGLTEKQVLKATTVHQELRVVRRNVKRGRAQEVPSGESMCRPRVSYANRWVIPAALLYVLGAAEDRVRGAGVSAQRHPHRHRNPIAHLQRADVDEKGFVRSGEPDGWVPDSKTPNGVAEVPLTDIAVEAFRAQLAIPGPGEYLFPSDENASGDQKTFKTAWLATLRRAKVPYFRIYDLRSTYATRLNAGSVAGHAVAPSGRRQGVQEVFGNEAAYETRGAGETQPAGKRNRSGFWHSRSGLNRVLAQ
jgi:integrase